MLNRYNRQKQDKAAQILEQELDIAKFLKKQMISSLTLKMLFSKLERLLLRNQAKPFIINDENEQPTSDENINLSELESQKAKSPYFYKLAEGLV